MNKSQLRQLIRESIREIMGGKQMLNENLFCPPGYAGTSCGSGGDTIWCESPGGGGTGLPPGCFCRRAGWCNQNGSNPCMNVVQTSDGKTVCKDDTTLNKPLDNSFDLSMGKINEDKLPSCWCCFGGLGPRENRNACHEQPGKVDGCYKSSSKCRRKCGKNDMVSQNTPTQYS